MNEQTKDTNSGANHRSKQIAASDVRNRGNKPKKRSGSHAPRPAAHRKIRSEEGQARTTTPDQPLRNESLSFVESQIINEALKPVSAALRAAALRLLARAEAEARAGKPRLLEALTEILKPRIHHLLHHLAPLPHE
jgi:hypothetical protein